MPSDRGRRLVVRLDREDSSILVDIARVAGFMRCELAGLFADADPVVGSAHLSYTRLIDRSGRHCRSMHPALAGHCELRP